jgi:hypothetical protein
MQCCEPTGTKYAVRREFYPHTSPAGKGSRWEWAGEVSFQNLLLFNNWESIFFVYLTRDVNWTDIHSTAEDFPNFHNTVFSTTLWCCRLTGSMKWISCFWCLLRTNRCSHRTRYLFYTNLYCTVPVRGKIKNNSNVSISGDRMIFEVVLQDIKYSWLYCPWLFYWIISFAGIFLPKKIIHLQPLPEVYISEGQNSAFSLLVKPCCDKNHWNGQCEDNYCKNILTRLWTASIETATIFYRNLSKTAIVGGFVANAELSRYMKNTEYKYQHMWLLYWQ